MPINIPESNYYVWEALTEDNLVGESISRWQFTDKTFVMDGEFGGATISIQGSHDINLADDDSSWHVATDYQGNDITRTDVGAAGSLENFAKFRPKIDSGASGTTDVVVKLLCV